MWSFLTSCREILTFSAFLHLSHHVPVGSQIGPIGTCNNRLARSRAERPLLHSFQRRDRGMGSLNLRRRRLVGRMPPKATFSAET
jgi:hypothetical protein